MNCLLLFTAGSCLAFAVSYYLVIRPLERYNADLTELLERKYRDLYLKDDQITRLTIQNARLKEELLEQVEQSNEDAR